MGLCDSNRFLGLPGRFHSEADISGTHGLALVIGFGVDPPAGSGGCRPCGSRTVSLAFARASGHGVAWPDTGVAAGASHLVPGWCTYRQQCAGLRAVVLPVIAAQQTLQWVSSLTGLGMQRGGAWVMILSGLISIIISWL